MRIILRSCEIYSQFQYSCNYGRIDFLSRNSMRTETGNYASVVL